MIKHTFIAVLLFSSIFGYAQNVGVGTALPDASAKLEINSTLSGLLIPRMTTTQRNAISNPAEALLVYDITTKSFWYYESGWEELNVNPNTLDNAYDEGGAGAGRTIDATDGAVSIEGEDGFWVSGTFGSGDVIGYPGAGTRLFFNPSKSAFRVGTVSGTEWDDANVGNYSIGLGVNAEASGAASMALGSASSATQTATISIGSNVTASALYARAIGHYATASGNASTSIGYLTTASGESAMALGFDTDASGDYSFASNYQSDATGDYAISMGRSNQSSGESSFSAGYLNTSSGNYSTSLGVNNTASASSAVAIGNGNTGSGLSSVALGYHNTAAGYNSVALGAESTADAYASMAIGQFNVGGGSPALWVATDPLFEVGIGTSASPDNALTVLKNGNIGAGTPTPSSTLDVEGTLQYVDGNEAADYVLRSDASGNATWVEPNGLITGMWALSGNSGTDPSTDFIGTTDNQDLVFRTNGTEQMRLKASGNLNLGASSVDYSRIYAFIPSSNTSNYYCINAQHEGSLGSQPTYSFHGNNNATTTNTKFGISSLISSAGTGPRFGISNTVNQNSSSNSIFYGIKNTLETYGSGDHYGVYTDMNIEGSTTSDNNYTDFKTIDFGTPSYSGTVYGDYIDIDISKGDRYGEYKELDSDANYDGSLYGDYNKLYGTGDGANYGVYNNIATTGDGTKFGVNNFFPDGNFNGTIYGVLNSIENDGSSIKYGTYNYLECDYGVMYGTYNLLIPGATNSSAVYGVHANITQAGSGTHTGGYFSAEGSGNYGIQAINTDLAGWAGYFTGRGYFSGNVGIGVANPTYELEIDGDVYATGGDFYTDVANGVINAGGGVMSSTINYIGDSYTAPSNANGDEDLYISDDLELGNQGYKPGGGSWATASDRRLKKNIEPYKDGLDEVLQINPVSYQYNDRFQTLNNGETYYGIIAQEMQEIAPYMIKSEMLGSQIGELEDGSEQVIEKGESYLTYDSSALLYMLVNAIKEQQTLIETQQAAIEQLQEALKTK